MYAYKTITNRKQRNNPKFGIARETFITVQCMAYAESQYTHTSTIDIQSAYNDEGTNYIDVYIRVCTIPQTVYKYVYTLNHNQTQISHILTLYNIL